MYKIPKVEQKVWGRRTRLYSNGGVEVYLLDLEPVDGKPVACSIHHHTMKYNRFFVVSGRVGLEHGVGPESENPLDVPGSRWQLKAGDEYTVPPGEVHRFIVIEKALIIETTWADKITEDSHRQDEGHVLEEWPCAKPSNSEMP